MAFKNLSRPKRLAIYAASSVFAFIAAFYITFPYQPLKERVRLEARRVGYLVDIGSLTPGFFAIHANDVSIVQNIDGDIAVEALKLNSISAGLALLPPGLKIKVKGFNGTMAVVVSKFLSTRIQFEAQGIDVSQSNLKGFSGIDFSGILDAQFDVTLPNAATKNSVFDWSQAVGVLSLQTNELVVLGGTANMRIPQFGPGRTPIDLPKIIFGNVTGKLTAEKGIATVEGFKSTSPDIEFDVSGTLKLGKRLAYSEADLKVRFKPNPEFQKRLGIIGSALTMVQADPQAPEWRLGRLTGFIGRPEFK